MMNREQEGLYGEFHYHPVLQPEESRKQGRPVYKDALYIKIQIKGQKNQIRSRLATEQDQQEFPSAWSAFCKSEQTALVGTPLSAIPGIGPSVELELKQLGIMTVEDMAALPDAAMDKFRGGMMFRQRAKAYLEAMKIIPAAPIQEPPVQQAGTESTEPVDVEMLSRDPNTIPKRRGRPPKDRTLQ